MQNGVFLNNIKYLSSKEAGDYSGYTHDYISRLCRSGKIPGTKVGKVWFVEAESFQKFLENHGDHKNEVCQNLSKERKEEYQDSLEEKEVKELSQFSLPKITIPKYISQEVFAVSLSVLVVFGTYLVKDEPFVYATFENSKERVSAQLVSTQENLKNFKNGIHDGLEDSSQKMIASVFEVTSEESIDNFKSSSKEFLTYENLFNTTVHLITGTRDGINNSLASYLEFINTAGDVIVATSYKVLDFERGFSFNDLRFKDTVDVIALSKESVSKAVDAVKNKSIGVYGNAISNVSNIQSAVKDVPNNLSAVSFSTIPNFFEGIAEGARTRIASWLKFGESEESPQEEKEIVQTVINQPVIERVVETERVVVTSGITEEDVTLGLEQLNNKLSAEIYRLSDINAGNIINNYNVISHTNKIDTLKSVAITSSTFVDGTISGSTSFSGTTGSFSGAVSVASLAVSGDTALAGSLSLGGLTVDTAGLVYASSSKNVGIGTSTPYAKLSVVGQVVGEYFTATSTTATSTFSGGLLATRAPTTPHTFSSWTTGATNSALFDAAFVVNPASAVSDSNLISAGVGGSVRFLVDAEGDVFVNNLTSVGSVTLSTTSASTFTVEGNTTLGDSISDTTVINGTLTVTGATSVSTTDGNFGVGTTSPWARLSVSGTSNDSTTPLLSISTSTASATSTAIQVDANGKFGIGTSTPSEQLSVEGNALINGTLTSGALTTTGALTGTHVTANSTSATSTFAGGLAVETSGLVYDYSTNRVGIGTASPAVSLHINGTDGIIIPVGTTAQRPTGQTGTLRYNTTSSTFEGYNGSTWSGLGGVIDVDQDTYILAESSSGADEDVLFFFTGGSEKARLTTAGNFGIGTTSPYAKLSVVGEVVASHFTGTSTSASTFMGNVGINTLNPQGRLSISSANQSLTWSQVGSDLNISGAGVPAVTALSPNRIAFVDSSNDDLRVYEFNGSTWSQVGAGLNINLDNQSITALSPNRIAFIDSGNADLRVYEFNGSTWSQVGSDLNISGAGVPAVTALSPNRIAFVDSSNDDLRVYEFNGSTWSQVGSDLNISGVINATLTTLSPNRVAFIDSGNNDLRVYQFSTPLLYVADDEDYPYLSVSDNGYTLTEALAVRTELRVGQSATSTTALNSPALIVSGDSTFSSKVGIGTTTPWAQLSIVGQSGNHSFVINDTSNNTDFVVTNSGNVGIGTTSPYAKLSVVGETVSAFFTATTTATSTFGGGLASSIGDLIVSGLGTTNNVLLNPYGGNVGIGTTSPSTRFAVANAVASAQYRLAYDNTQYADFQVDSAGDLIISPSGGDVRVNDENLYVCSGGACPTGTPVGNGNIIAETTLGVGTSTPTQQLSVANNIFIGGGGSPAIGTATSTFEGDITILGKLDVGTIDPVYTIDGIKYATYGHSTVGIKEETVFSVTPSVLNEKTGEYEYEINFDELEEGSDMWLFYQVTSLGEEWEDLVVTLTPGFKGAVHYEKVVEEGKLVIASSEAGEISVRLIANRFDGDQWPNLRPDQGTGWKGFVLKTKEKIFKK